MKIIVALDSFKGCLSSKAAGEAVMEGIRKAIPSSEIRLFQLSDGGEGMLEAIAQSIEISRIKVLAKSPEGYEIEAEAGYKDSTFFIESATTCGLNLIAPRSRNPLRMDSGGLGIILRYAISKGFKKIPVGLGGSGVNDAGIGMLRELGYKFLKKDGSPIKMGCEEIGEIEKIDGSEAIVLPDDCRIIVVSDVKNPLYGENGASRIFGIQKGGNPEMLAKLDNDIKKFSEVAVKQGWPDYAGKEGAGAAGGLGYALLTFLRAEMQSGVETILEISGFDKALKDADIVITGEGRLDRQTLMGKLPMGVLKHARRYGAECIAIGGGVDTEAAEDLLKAGFRAVFPILSNPISLEEAKLESIATENLRRTSEMIMRVMTIGRD